MNLKIIEGGNTRKGATLDYILAGKVIKIDNLQIMDCQTLSDHNILVFNLNLNSPKVNLRGIKIPNKKLANNLHLIV